MACKRIVERWPFSLICAGLLACGPVHAHLPELYGREYVRVDPNEYQTPENRDRIKILRPPLPVENATQQQVRAEEAAAGAYGAGIADPLINLAELQLERGDVDDAVASMRRAIQLVRINDGLYSDSQLPLLRRLMIIYRDHGYYNPLGDTYVHYYRVVTSGGKPLAPGQLPTLLEYLQWERQLYATRSDGNQRTHLLRAYDTNKRLLQQADNTTPSEFVSLAMSQLHNLYLILGERPRAGLGGDLGREDRRLLAIQRIAESKGRLLLEKCIANLASAPPRQRADIHRELGDWLLWNERPRSAQQEYARVIALMRDAGATEELATWFDEPAELPDKLGLWSPIQEQNGSARVVVEASYEVTRQGEVRRVEVSSSGDEQDWQARRIGRMLRESHFRPRIGDAGFASGPRVTRHYRLVGTR